MSGIRPFTPADVPAAVALFEQVQQTGSSVAGLERLYHALLFEDPWTDPELPGLVYEDEEGALAGYITRCTRRFRFDGEPIRISTTIHFLVDPQVRRKAVGALLSARLLGGRQDASHTEGPTEATLRMWKSMRGDVVAGVDACAASRRLLERSHRRSPGRGPRERRASGRASVRRRARARRPRRRTAPGPHRRRAADPGADGRAP
jgi:hypothetical protein